MGESSRGPGGYNPTRFPPCHAGPAKKKAPCKPRRGTGPRRAVFLFLARRRGASTDTGASLTVFLFSVFLEVEGAILARRRTLGPALQFFCFWHVEGALLARRRTLGPCLAVFLFSVFRRSTVGTSTDIGTSLTVFLFFCFWHVEGALLARRRTLGLALQFF